MNKKIDAVICDLDGTLADAAHRVHWIEKQPKNWPKFFSEAYKDKVVPWCLELMKEYQSKGIKIIFVTGRHTGLANSTTGWIYTHTPFEAILNDSLFMRPEGDFREDTIVKKELYINHIEPYYNILLAVDDKKSIIDMWESFGIKTIHCPAGYKGPKK